MNADVIVASVDHGFFFDFGVFCRRDVIVATIGVDASTALEVLPRLHQALLEGVDLLE